MTFDELDEWCLSFPRAVKEFPFGPHTAVWRVGSGGRMFALANAQAVTPVRVNLKCEPELADRLRASYASILPGYHMNKRHWNTVVLDGSIPDDMVRDLVEDSYDLVAPPLRRVNP